MKRRYQAARLVNKEMIALFFEIGKKISKNVRENAWGSKVLEQISTELQKELPGIKDFSSGNLKKMRVFADFWQDHLSIGSTVPNQLRYSFETNSSTVPNQFPENFADTFFSVGFSHHHIIASKSNSFEEAWFYRNTRTIQRDNAQCRNSKKIVRLINP